ncbi:MAG: disulfide bond formation protein B [Gammaproteobacteria bacterium]|nr:MAG: disulfide bond formation protein B [Gammaproteobacteria bacterium]
MQTAHSWRTINPRLVNGLGVLLAITSYLFAYFFLQVYLELEPCPLCMIDRIFVTAAGLFFLLAFIHNPATFGQRIYGLFAALMALAGILVCWRHIYLQNLPTDLIPSCAPDLDYMLEVLPTNEMLSIIFNTSGECADTQWVFLGFTIPEQTLMVFNVLFALGLYQVFRPRP